MPGNQQVFSAAMSAAERHRWDSNWEEANREYQKALKEFPEDAAARSGLGFCHMQTKNWQQALSEYEYVLQRDSSNVIALSKTAELYGILNRREDAYSAYLHLADLYSQAGQGARAEAAWQKAVQLSPGNPEPHERLASYYFEKKDIVAMIQQRLAAAQGYLLRNEPGPARIQCEEVLRADSGNIQAQQLLARILGGDSGGQGEMETRVAGTNAPQISSSGYMMNRAPAAGGSIENKSITDSVTSGNTSGGNTGIMGNMGSAGNYGGVGNSGPASTMTGAGGMNPAPHKRITASQVTEVLKQAQMYQEQRRFNDAIDLCEQILESGFDRPDARYFLGWLYQEQQRWDEAIRQFQHLLNDPDYALSCYYALGQCYRAQGDLRSATVHFDEAVDRVNLDALTLEESDQLVQLCQEAAEAHRMLGEQEQALTVYNALLGFLRSRGWHDKVAQVEYMLQQAQGAPSRPITPPTANVPQAPGGEQTVIQRPYQDSISDAATMAFNASMMQQQQQSMPPQQQAMPPQQQGMQQPSVSTSGELPDWLTGILSESGKTQAAPPTAQPQPPANVMPPAPAEVPPPPPPAASDWLTEGPQQASQAPQAPQVPPAPQGPTGPLASGPLAGQQASGSMAQVPGPTAPPPPAQAPAPPPPAAAPQPDASTYLVMPQPERQTQAAKPNAEDLLSQMSGSRDHLRDAAEPVLASTADLPESVRGQVVRSMQDIQKYIDHGLLTSATEECLRVIDIAPQYLDVHQVLCEIYVRQGKIEQAVTKYAILVDTYVVNGRTDDAIATY
ncbi:MAG: tetratricopeptide repeat protein, partial [Ktedonobacteraceae bacterium]|nr:tetratricopeptide repeat protein [Ktedonobacteraceae bacterium]